MRGTDSRTLKAPSSESHGGLPSGKERLADRLRSMVAGSMARSPGMGDDRPVAGVPGRASGVTYSLAESRSCVSEIAPRRSASLASRARRGPSAPTANLSYRFARCCLTAACVMTRSSAIACVEAGSVNMSRSSSGRHSARRTSRSREVRDGGASSACVAVACAASGSWNTSRVWPMRISSPCWSRCEDHTRSPLTDVPFDDPRSLTHQPAENCSKTACRRLAVGSSSSGTSFSGALPIVTRPASSAIRRLRTPEITSICGATMASSLRRGAATR